MKTAAIHATSDNYKDKLDAAGNAESQLVVVFSSKEILEGSTVVNDLKNFFKKARIIGCSTAGEIGDTVEDESISILSFEFDHTRVECTAVEITNAADSYVTGEKVIKNLLGEDLAGVFVLAPGWNINGSDLVDGMRSVLPAGVSLTGGLAGDGTNFNETCTLLDEGISHKQVVAFGLYGKNVSVRSGSRGGWKPFGPQRRVTRAEKNVLFELDHKPALDLYKEYLGDKADDLPASGLLYPFAIMDEQDASGVGLVRTILDINEEDKSLVLAGNLDEGSMVSLMHASTDELSDGAEEAAKIGSNGRQADNVAVICVSCVGRKILMGDDTEEELEMVRDTIENAAISGFYSYGEISHYETTNRPELHNQTMTVTVIEEHAA